MFTKLLLCAACLLGANDLEKEPVLNFHSEEQEEKLAFEERQDQEDSLLACADEEKQSETANV